MSTPSRTDPYSLSVHKTRVQARILERKLQRRLDRGEQNIVTSAGVLVPEWAKGVRVSKAGRRQFQVIATENRGR